jgi:hypothetical protein
VPLSSIGARAARDALRPRAANSKQRIRGIARRVFDRQAGHAVCGRAAHVRGDLGRLHREAAFEVRVHRTSTLPAISRMCSSASSSVTWLSRCPRVQAEAALVVASAGKPEPARRPRRRRGPRGSASRSSPTREADGTRGSARRCRASGDQAVFFFGANAAAPACGCPCSSWTESLSSSFVRILNGTRTRLSANLTSSQYCRT